MAGRKPDFRLMFVEDNGRGKKVWFKLGSAWKNTETNSVGIEVNAGVPITLNPHTKLVLVENTTEEEGDTEFNQTP
jgi:hypothetical protein